MRRRGYTLMEMSVVVVILVVIAALVLPNISANQRTERAQAYLSGLRDAAVQARDHAVTSGRTVVMSYDEGQKEISLAEEAEGTSFSMAPKTSSDRATLDSARTAPDNTTSTGETVIKHLTLPDGLTVNGFKLDGKDSTSAEWQLHFYADGGTDSGGLEIDDNGATYSLVVSNKGIARLIRDKFPEASTEKWEAGEYEKRL